MPDTTPPAAPSILFILDNVGPEQGQVLAGQMTDDQQPTVRVSLTNTASGTDALQPGDTVDIWEGSVRDTGPGDLGHATLTADDIARGYIDIDDVNHGMGIGNRPVQATATDAAGNRSAASVAFSNPYVSPTGETRFDLTDGTHLEGYTDAFTSPSNQTTFLQRFDAAGHAVGQPYAFSSMGYLGTYSITSQPNGAFVGLFSEGDHFRDMAGRVIDASGTVLNSFTVGEGSTLTTNASGAFIATWPSDGGVSPGPGLADFSAAGVAMSNHLFVSGPITGVTVEPDGKFDVHFNDFADASRPRTLVLDPSVHSSLVSPNAAAGYTVTDDAGRPISSTTTDASPTFHIGSFSGGEVQLGWNRGTDPSHTIIAPSMGGTTDVTAVTTDGEGLYDFSVRYETAEGLVSRFAFTSFTIQSAEHAGTAGADTETAAANGSWMTGQGGADVFVFNTQATHVSTITDFAPGVDKLDFRGLLSGVHYAGSDPFADGYITFQGRTNFGDTIVNFDPDGSAGGAAPEATADLQGVSADQLHASDFIVSGSPPPPPPPPGGPGQVIQGQGTEVGGAGDDTLVADFAGGHQILTGAGGADAFEIRVIPAAADHITDFTIGTDRLDLSAIFSSIGYAGSDPVADGYVRLVNAPGGDGTYVYVDRDGPASGDPWGTFVVQLDHTESAGQAGGPSQFTWAQLQGGGSPPPPPPPPPPDPPPPPAPPPPGGGSRITETSGNQTLAGGAGDDTITALHGGDTMTGAGGADHFAFGTIPWSPSEITDFTKGVDKLDLSKQLSDYHYAGSDPIGDGWIKLIDDGHGDTWVYFDRDGPGSADQWGTFVVTLDHVTASSITDADLVLPGIGSPSPPPPPPPSGGVVLHGQDGGSNLTGGAGDDTLIAGHGPDTMAGAGGADHFEWDALPWQGGEITDFTHGADHIDLSRLLASVGYAGSDPIADGYVRLASNGAGDTWLYFDTDGHGTTDQWGTYLARIDHAAPSQLTAADFIFH